MSYAASIYLQNIKKKKKSRCWMMKQLFTKYVKNNKKLRLRVKIRSSNDRIAYLSKTLTTEILKNKGFIQ